MEIIKYKSTIAERKDIENAIASGEKQQAILDYICICDHPEIFGEEGEA